METRARETLMQFGLRPSPQRMAIMQYLLSHKTHPTAEAIYADLQPHLPTLSRTTVYNTVSMLAGRGAILALDLDPVQMHYDGDTSPHAHFLCIRCGTIHDVWLDATGWDHVMVAATPPHGSSVADIQLSYKGLCPLCDAQPDC